MAICHDCEMYVGEGGALAPIGSDLRLYDYVLDPVSCEIAHERFPEVVPPSSASGVPLRLVLGYSVQEFAPAPDALTDPEEMVLVWCTHRSKCTPSLGQVSSRMWGTSATSGSGCPCSS